MLRTFFTYIRLMEPREWFKNIVIFAPLFFAKEFFDAQKFTTTFFTFLVFCITTSTVYILGDYYAIEHNKRHRKKNNHPFITEEMSSVKGLFFAGIIFLIALTIALWITPILWLLVIAYLIFNFIYIRFLKHIPTIEIVTLVGFYVLCLIAGGLVTNTPISDWLIIWIIFLSLFLVLGKRRYSFRTESKEYSPILAYYNELFLEHALSVSGTLTIVTYSIFIILTAPEHAVYSILFVIVGMLRYFQAIHTTRHSRPFEYILVSDPLMLGTLFLWIVYLFVIFY